jgi:hypothetical protein
MDTIVNNTTEFFDIPLPFGDNPLSVDVDRIVNALVTIDATLHNHVGLTLGNIPASPLNESASAGIIIKAARSDHVHPFPSALDIGSAELGDMAGYALAAEGATGEANTAARSDHVHPFPSASQLGVSLLGNTRAVSLASHGTVGTLSTSARSDHAHPYPTADNVGAAHAIHTHTPQEVGAAEIGWTAAVRLANPASAGSLETAARSDHVHPLPTINEIGAAAIDHTHSLESLGAVLLGDVAGSDLAASAGVGGLTTAARSDHVHKLPSVAELGVCAVGNVSGYDLASQSSAGSMETAARSDHVHKLPSVAELGAAAAQHSHNASDFGASGVGNEVAKPLNTVGSVGSSSSAARSDHVHIYPTPAQIGAASTDEENTWTATQFHTNAICENAVSMTTNTINFLDAAVFMRTIGAETTFVFSGMLTKSPVASFILETTSTGAFTVTWPATVKWAGGIKPKLTSNGKDLFGFYTADKATSWRGITLAKDIK